jgi:hypothetical protein
MKESCRGHFFLLFFWFVACVDMWPGIPCASLRAVRVCGGRPKTRLCGVMQDGAGSAQSLCQDRVPKSLQSPLCFQDGLLACNHPFFEIRFASGSTELSSSLSCLHAGKLRQVRRWCVASGAVLPVLGSLTCLPAPRPSPAQLDFCSGSRLSDATRAGKSGLWPALMLHKFQNLIPALFILLLKRRGRIPAGFLARGVLLLSSLRHFDYRPTHCQQTYRMVVGMRKALTPFFSCSMTFWCLR